MTVATLFDRNAVRPGCDVDLDVPASSKKRTDLSSRSFKFGHHCLFFLPNKERISDSKCFFLYGRAARRGKIEPDREEVRTNCEWSTSDGGESFSSSLETDGAVMICDCSWPRGTPSFLCGIDGEAVIESPAVSDGVNKEARRNSSPDHGWVLVDSGATDKLKVLREDKSPPRGTQF